ncbi:MAG TPA: hypothetical protein VD833_15480 [Vicinamibacterales bacterium]|nr:hypothetical protein [Vicinamibacterales bacterium]
MPGPVPLAPDTIEIQLVSVLADQEHCAVVETVTLVVPPSGPKFCAGAVT